jgi:hypothetical protein
VHIPQGYDPLVLRTLAALLGTPPGYDAIGYVNDPTLAAPGSHVLDLLRVRVLSAPARASLALEEALWKHSDRFEPFHAGGDERITYFRNRRAYPVAWLVPRLRSVAPGAAIATVRDDSAIGGFDPAQEALVEQPPAAAFDPECWRRASPAAASRLSTPTIGCIPTRLAPASSSPASSRTRLAGARTRSTALLG